MSVTAFPLSWPEGWPRLESYRRLNRSPFKGATFARGRDRLGNELERLRASDIILSSNVPLKFNGEPRGDFRASEVRDPGVAVYFTLRGRQMSMCRDAYTGIVENITSLALAVEYLRGLERHGGAQMMERAFSGFARIEAPRAATCWDILGISKDSTADEITAAYRAKAMERHPDRGGSDAAMAELNDARIQAMRE